MSNKPGRPGFLQSLSDPYGHTMVSKRILTYISLWASNDLVLKGVWPSERGVKMMPTPPLPRDIL